VKISGPVQLLTCNFWAASQINQPRGSALGQKQPVSSKSIFSPGDFL